jgi:hypothetical protein
MVEQEDLEHSLALAGIQRNYNGGVFKNGAAKPFEEKVRVAQMWIDMNAAAPDNNNQPSIRMLASSAMVSRTFASKVVAELKEGHLVDPKSKIKNIPRGKGSLAISDEDGLFLLNMRRECNQRTLEDYRQALHQATGKWVARCTICQWFLKAHRIRGGGGASESLIRFLLISSSPTMFFVQSSTQN